MIMVKNNKIKRKKKEPGYKILQEAGGPNELEENLRVLFETSPYPSYLTDLKGNFLYSNNAFKQMFGYSNEELIAKNNSRLSILKSTEVTKVLKSITLNLHNQRLGPEEYTIKNKYESNVIAEIFTFPVSTNNTTLVLGIARDITKRKEAEKQNRKFNKVIETTSQSVIITSITGTVIYVNPIYYKFSGFTEEEVIGKSMFRFAHKKGAIILAKEVVPALLIKGNWSGEMTVVKKNKEVVSVDLICSLLKNEKNRPEHFVAIFSDITERKRSEQILKKQNLEYAALNAEYEKQNELLKIALKKAEESDRLKSSFLANISHEIRTPMNGILGFADLLNEPGLTGTDQQKYISIIKSSGERLLNILNDLIDISKIEAGQIQTNITETNINEQLDDIFNFFLPEVKEKGLEFFYEKLPAKSTVLVKTDREKLYAILTNLVKNAIKFTSKGSIAFGCYKKNNYLEFFVKDTGVGIPKDRQDAIFDRFVQADLSTSRVFEGAGLGLSITKAYIDLLGGKIWLKSEEGKGSEFYFTIPLKPDKRKTIADNS